jgi:hypothetical protein
MLNKFLCGIAIIVISGFGKFHAQQAIAATGFDATGSGGSSSYSVGQIDYSAKGANNEITEGLQQPYEIVTLAVSDNGNVEKNISLYPNPVKDILFVDFNQEKFSNSTYQLYDAQGKLIKNGNFSQKKNELNFSMLPASVYIIRIFSDNKMVKTFKIIKK